MAHAETKKVVLFVVEGPTEETAFGQAFENSFREKSVRFDIVHGDLTSKSHLPNRAREVIRKQILLYLEKDPGYRWRDLARIVQICDTDGAFVPDDNVISSSSGELEYCEDVIRATDINKLRMRNHRKAQAMSALSSIDALTYKGYRVPFSVYYLSRNMEHALHGISVDCSDDEKVQLAHCFRRLYGKSPDRFRDFLCSEALAISGGYRDTWNYIADGTNSLKRGSNIHLVFD